MEIDNILSEMKYKYLAISITNNCNINCEFCCNNCVDTLRMDMPIKTLKKIIDEASQTKIKAISLTGGEATLMKNLDSIMKYIIDKGMIVTLISNGHWAKNETITKKILLKWKKIGLNNLTISYDEYHSKFIGLDNIKYIIKSSNEIDLKVIIQSVHFINSNLTWLNNLLKDLGAVSVDFIEGLPVGGAKNFDDNMFIKGIGKDNLYCGKGSTLFISEKGEVYPCCSPVIESTFLKVGNVNDSSLSDMILKIKNNSVLYVLRNYGFNPFIKYADEIGIKLPNTVINGCDLCREIFSENNYFKFLYLCNKIVNTKTLEC